MAAAPVASVVAARVLTEVMVMGIIMMLTMVVITACEVLRCRETMLGRHLATHFRPVTRFSRRNVVGVEVKAVRVSGVCVTDVAEVPNLPPQRWLRGDAFN